MPQIDYVADHVQNSAPDFDRLKMKKDEKRRIFCIEKPTFNWVHTLRGPKLENGRGVKITEIRNGVETSKWDMDWISGPFCLGDPGILEDLGVDVKNCPACARSKQNAMYPPPERRFAMNIIAFKTKSDGSVGKPLSAECLIWKYTNRTYDKLYGISKEQPLNECDLILTCVSERFQQYDMMPTPNAVYKTSAEATALVKATYLENKVEDVEAVIGIKKKAEWIEEDLDKVAARWRTAEGTEAKAVDDGIPPPIDTAALTAGMADLLGEDTPAKPAQDTVATDEALAALREKLAVVEQKSSGNGSGNDWADIMGGMGGTDTAPAAKPTETAVDGPMDFSKLMSDLGTI